MNTTPGRGWNADDVESVPVCPACESASRRLVHAGLHDRLSPDAPGSWSLWACGGCASVYLDPRPTAQTIGRAYERYYTHHGEGSGEHEPSGLRARLLGSYLKKAFGYGQPNTVPLGALVVAVVPGARAMASQHVRHLARPRAGGRLLDVGCAAGGFLARMQSLGWDVTGVEPDPVSGRIARDRGLRVYESDAALAAAKPEPFDAITLSHTIEHLHDPVGTLAGYRELLQPGGSLWVATPNADAYGHRRYGRSWFPLEPPRHLVLFTPSSLATAFSRAGFVDVVRPPQTLQASSWIYRTSASMAVGGDGENPEPLGRSGRVAALWADIRTSLRSAHGEEIVLVGHRAGASR